MVPPNSPGDCNARPERRTLPGQTPVPTGRCLGRESAVTDILALLEQPGCRLMTLTGAPGVGKTRLAQALAEAAPRRLGCPLVWVSLAEVASLDGFLHALLGAFELPSTPGEEAWARLQRHAAHLELVLVLDNFEHLLPAVGA